MSEQGRVWDRQEGESLLWFRRFTKYRLMVPVHSLPEVWREEEPTKNHEKPREDPPGDWYRIAKQWHWEERAAAWDAYQDEQLEKQILAERKKVLKSHYALMHKRVQELDELATLLRREIHEQKKYYLTDVKQIGYGESAERVDLEVFNDKLISEFRATLTDIAAEMGERVKTTKQEHSGSLEVLQGARDALVSDLEALPDASQSQEHHTSAEANPL